MEAIRIKFSSASSALLEEPLLEPGTTIRQFIQDRQIPEDTINLTVDGRQVPGSYELQDGDFVVTTPRKVSGA